MDSNPDEIELVDIGVKTDYPDPLDDLDFCDLKLPEIDPESRLRTLKYIRWKRNIIFLVRFMVSLLTIVSIIVGAVFMILHFVNDHEFNVIHITESIGLFIVFVLNFFFWVNYIISGIFGRYKNSTSRSIGYIEDIMYLCIYVLMNSITIGAILILIVDYTREYYIWVTVFVCVISVPDCILLMVCTFQLYRRLYYRELVI
jgi:hypothetical protein